MPAAEASVAGVVQVISVAERDTILHAFPPTVTRSAVSAPVPEPSERNSKPVPLTVSSVPPPAEPVAGQTPVTVTVCVKVSGVSVGSCDRPLKETASEVVPEGALGTVQRTSESPPPLLLMLTTAQARPPRLTAGCSGGLSIVIVRVLPAPPVEGESEYTRSAGV